MSHAPCTSDLQPSLCHTPHVLPPAQPVPHTSCTYSSLACATHLMYFLQPSLCHTPMYLLQPSLCHTPHVLTPAQPVPHTSCTYSSPACATRLCTYSSPACATRICTYFSPACATRPMYLLQHSLCHTPHVLTPAQPVPHTICTLLQLSPCHASSVRYPPTTPPHPTHPPHTPLNPSWCHRTQKDFHSCNSLQSKIVDL